MEALRNVSSETKPTESEEASGSGAAGASSSSGSGLQRSGKDDEDDEYMGTAVSTELSASRASTASF